MQGSHMTTIAGTPYYMAPEILKGSYTDKADMWSLGVLLYTLVSGYLPFQGNTHKDIFPKIKRGEFHFNHKEFNQVSDECKDLIRNLLQTDESRRYDGRRALGHKWFEKFAPHKDVSDEVNKLNDQVLSNLKNYKSVSHLKRKVMNMLIKMANTNEITVLTQYFEEIDIDGTGKIDAKELKAIMDKTTIKMTNEEINNVIKQIDEDGQNITYSEFIAAAIDLRSIVTPERVKAIFT